jgi:hypothetical protein
MKHRCNRQDIFQWYVMLRIRKILTKLQKPKS